MPDKTVYTITKKGTEELLNTLRDSFPYFDYDTIIFSITVFFLIVLLNVILKIIFI